MALPLVLRPCEKRLRDEAIFFFVAEDYFNTACFAMTGKLHSSQ